jgi:hypothetical protein
MPLWFKDARDNIAKVKAVIGGDWIGQVSPHLPSVELRVGTFGNLAPDYLLLERTVYQHGLSPFHRLSVLFYSTDCKAFEMLSLDRLSNPDPLTTGDCSRSFPIEIRSDGSLTFSYTDWNSERVSVQVNKASWQETRDAPGLNEKREIELVRAPRPAVGGNVQ